MRRIILASTSPYRRQLLARLQIQFDIASPNTDETPICGEPPDARALRLAEEKARALTSEHPDVLLIGGDQTIAANGTLFDKPGTVARAVNQLKAMRGQLLRFYTAVAIVDTKFGDYQTRLTSHTALLRQCSDEEIERYVQKETALNCAGGAQIEGLGISLMTDIQGGDPTALIGMSLIAVADLLRNKGIAIP